MKTKEWEKHYSITQESGSAYIGHFTPSSGSAKNINNSIISHLTDCGFYLDKLDILVCDVPLLTRFGELVLYV